MLQQLQFESYEYFIIIIIILENQQYGISRGSTNKETLPEDLPGRLISITEYTGIDKRIKLVIPEQFAFAICPLTVNGLDRWHPGEYPTTCLDVASGNSSWKRRIHAKTVIIFSFHLAYMVARKP